MTTTSSVHDYTDARAGVQRGRDRAPVTPADPGAGASPPTTAPRPPSRWPRARSAHRLRRGREHRRRRAGGHLRLRLDGPTYDETSHRRRRLLPAQPAPGHLRAGLRGLLTGDHSDASVTVEVTDGPVEVDTVQLTPVGRRDISGRVLGSDGSGLEDARSTSTSSSTTTATASTTTTPTAATP